MSCSEARALTLMMGSVIPSSSQGLGDAPPVDAGEHQIDDRKVGAFVADLAKRTIAVVDDFDVHPGSAEMRRHRICDHGIVLGNEHSRHSTRKGTDRPGRHAHLPRISHNTEP